MPKCVYCNQQIADSDYINHIINCLVSTTELVRTYLLEKHEVNVHFNKEKQYLEAEFIFKNHATGVSRVAIPFAVYERALKEINAMRDAKKSEQISQSDLEVEYDEDEEGLDVEKEVVVERIGTKMVPNWNISWQQIEAQRVMYETKKILPNVTITPIQTKPELPPTKCLKTSTLTTTRDLKAKQGTSNALYSHPISHYIPLASTSKQQPPYLIQYIYSEQLQNYVQNLNKYYSYPDTSFSTFSLPICINTQQISPINLSKKEPKYSDVQTVYTSTVSGIYYSDLIEVEDISSMRKRASEEEFDKDGVPLKKNKKTKGIPVKCGKKGRKP